MKIILRVFALAVLLASCTEPKVQLRATQSSAVDSTGANDSLKVDSVVVNKKN